MLNMRGENVEIITPLITIEELQANDRENVHILQETGNESGTLTLLRHEHVRKQIRHLTRKKRKSLSKYAKTLIFHLEGVILMHTTAPEINTRTDSAS